MALGLIPNTEWLPSALSRNETTLQQDGTTLSRAL